ncbi:MAG: 50S ribosomal protein L7Ae [Candidatus Geothermarchaeales archaeon]
MSKTPFEKFEVPRELVEAAYESLSLAQEVRGVKKGTNETTKAVERGIAKIVLIAENVDPPEVVAHLPILCREKKIPYMYVPSKSELGEACGLGVAAAAASIVDPGEGKKLVDDIIAHLKKLGVYGEEG